MRHISKYSKAMVYNGAMARDTTRLLYSHDKIQKRVKEIAVEICKDYQGKKPILVGILKGSFVFLADLLRELYACGLKDVEVDFLTISSYGHGTEYSGSSTLLSEMTLDVKGKDVLLVEDIIDTGYTLRFVKEYLKEKHPASVKIVTILDKKERREVDVPVEYVGFTLKGSPWVEGYGLDGGKYGRGRSDVVEKILTK